MTKGLAWPLSILCCACDPGATLRAHNIIGGTRTVCRYKMLKYLEEDSWVPGLRASAWLSPLVECCPVHQKIASLIPGQGTYLSCRFKPEATN